MTRRNFVKLSAVAGAACAV
ncbi:MAG: twin-arginine translocation signal domain-containing protein, partial [Coriobacteriales bacterium]